MPAPTDPAQIFDMFGQLFEDFFASSPDITVTEHLTEAEAIVGTTREVSIERHAKCATCDGRGGESPVECAACKGRGTKQQTQGFFMVSATCASCKGVGGTYTKVCDACRGTKRTRSSEQLSVAIPAGTEHGATIRVAGRGQAGVDGRIGDVLVYVLVGDREDPRVAQARAFGFPSPHQGIPQARVVPPQRDSRAPLIAGALFMVVAVLLALMLVR